MNRIYSLIAIKLFFILSIMWGSISAYAGCDGHWNSVPCDGCGINSGSDMGNVQAHNHYNWQCGADTDITGDGSCYLNNDVNYHYQSNGGGCGDSTTNVNVDVRTDATTRCHVEIHSNANDCDWRQNRYIKINQVVAIQNAPAASVAVGLVSTQLAYTATNSNGTNTKGLNTTETWSASGTNGCSVSSDGLVTYGKVPGTCTVVMTLSGSIHLVANSAQFTTTLFQTAQTMTVTTAAPVGPVSYGATFNVVASATGYAPQITTLTGGSCMASSTIAGTTTTAKITIVNTSAPCYIYYNQDGMNAGGYYVYTAVAEQSSTTTISTATVAQTITFNAQAAQTYSVGGTFPINPTATSDSGLLVTYTSSTLPVCTITGIGNNIVAIQTAGTCTIKADQAGNANYNAATQASQNITINKAAQTITVTQAAPATAAKGSTFPVSATASSGLLVAITTTTPTICTAPGGATGSTTITVLSTIGTCTVSFAQAGNGNYNPATTVTNDSTVTLLQQTITVTQSAPSQIALNGTFDVTATSNSGLAVAISIDSVLNGCAIQTGGSGTANIKLTSGTVACKVKFNQVGNVAYDPATEITNTVVAIRTAQSITVGTPGPASAIKNATFNVAASASSALGVTITVSGGCTKTVGGTNTATIQMDNIGASNCTVSYNQAGNDSYSPAPQVLNVVKDGTVPTLTQITAVPTPTNQTPEYSFKSSETGTIIYGGDCSSTTTNSLADPSINVIVFNELAVGVHSNCTVRVVDGAGNTSTTLAIPSFTVQSNVVAYVKTVASGTADCTSWANACANIQTAINSPGVNEVWIASGVYRPASTINLKAGVGLYGGFAGNETSYVPSYIDTFVNIESGVVSSGATYGQTSSAVNVTIISGDKDNNDVIDSRGLVISAADVVGTNLAQILNANALTVLPSKRVKISNLILNAARGASSGGAIGVVNSYVEVDRTQFVFNKGNTGGAVSVTSGGKFVAIDSVFLKNESTGAGGAIASSGLATDVTEIQLQNSIFESNIAGTNGGAIQHAAGKLWVLNSTFFGNSLLSATGSGGAIDLASLTYPSAADIRYVTMVKNIAGTSAAPNGRGGAININSGATAVATLANSLVVGNSALATTGTNIADMSKISDGGYNVVGFNNVSGMITGTNTPYSFVGGTSATAPAALVTDILDVTLADNGGYTATLKLTEASYARDRIPNIHADCENLSSVGEDQRGNYRPDVSGKYCDVGAMELNNIDPCVDPNRQKGFFVMTYPNSNTTCIASGGVSFKVGLLHPFHLILLMLIGIILPLKRIKNTGNLEK